MRWVATFRTRPRVYLVGVGPLHLWWCSLGATHTGSYDVAVTPGTYEVFYARSENVAMMPRNENARVTCFVVE